MTGSRGFDDDERAHLDRLLAALTPEARKRRKAPVKDTVSAGIRVLLDSMEHLPAVVFNSRLDVLAANDLGRALYGPMLDADGPVNSARFVFLQEQAARTLFPEWERIANDTVSVLRVESGRRPDDPALVALVGQLSTRSQEFRTRWAAHDVKAHRAGAKVFRHPLIGEVILPFENLTVDATGDQVLTVFTPQPGSPEHDAIRLLASWNAHAPTPAEAERSSPLAHRVSSCRQRGSRPRAASVLSSTDNSRGPQRLADGAGTAPRRGLSCRTTAG